tara:strand:+ start:438 stop:821 length:384 start_codon:yes stop_codon:yes gene_type:complete
MYKYSHTISGDDLSNLLSDANKATWKINKGPEVDYCTAQFGGHGKLIKIPPGGWIKRHSDNGGRPAGTRVFHTVISTNDQCLNISYVDETQKIHMPVGTVWEFDTLPEHESYNNGKTDRIHLVMDVL